MISEKDESKKDEFEKDESKKDGFGKDENENDNDIEKDDLKSKDPELYSILDQEGVKITE